MKREKEGRKRGSKWPVDFFLEKEDDDSRREKEEAMMILMTNNCTFGTLSSFSFSPLSLLSFLFFFLSSSDFFLPPLGANTNTMTMNGKWSAIFWLAVYQCPDTITEEKGEEEEEVRKEVVALSTSGSIASSFLSLSFFFSLKLSLLFSIFPLKIFRRRRRKYINNQWR